MDSIHNSLNTKDNKDGWSRATPNVFWGEIAPCDHVVQIYENDTVFLDLLHGFVSGGIKANDSVIVIATKAHLKALNELLAADQLDVFKLTLTGQYVPLDADETLAKFMVNDWPDESLFMHTVTNLIAKAKKNDRQVRAFGEMVALLWAKGNVGATVRLEHLWSKFCETEVFCLFCAYPKSGFTQDASDSIMHICGAHSKMITSIGKSDPNIFYKSTAAQLVG